jgi:hypothetical protein
LKAGLELKGVKEVFHDFSLGLLWNNDHLAKNISKLGQSGQENYCLGGNLRGEKKSAPSGQGHLFSCAGIDERLKDPPNPLNHATTVNQ